MKCKAILYLAIVGSVLMGLCQQAAAIEVLQSPPELAQPPLAVTEFRASNDMPDYFQLYNFSNDIVQLSDWSIVIKSKENTQQYVLPSAYILPGQYSIVSASQELRGEGVLPLEDTMVFTPDDTVWLSPNKAGFAEVHVPVVENEQSIRYELSRTKSGRPTAAHKYTPLDN